jgi:hypothetical protein
VRRRITPKAVAVFGWPLRFASGNAVEAVRTIAIVAERRRGKRASADHCGCRRSPPRVIDDR